MNQDKGSRTKSQAYLRDEILKWREKRQSRMAARILHNKNGNVSSAVFGAISTLNGNKSILKNRQICTADVSKSESAKSSVTGPKIKRQKVPEIKHTLASKLRMIKANPLLEVRGIITVPEKYKKGLDRIDVKNKSIHEEEPKLPANLVKNSQKQKSSLKAPNDQKKTGGNKLTSKERSSRVDQLIKTKNVNRRSLSADGSCKKFPHADTNELEYKMKKFHSVGDMQGFKSPIMEDEEELENDIFPLPETPLSIQTPQKPRYASFSKSVGQKSIISPSSVFTPTADVMRKQLSDWLKKRGKSFGSFHHLKCFGLHASDKIPDSRKSNYYQTPKRSICNKSFTKPNSLFTSTKEMYTVMAGTSTDKDFMDNLHGSESENKENLYTQNSGPIAQDALEDLIKIIKLGYPLEQCNQWLSLICRSYPDVKEVPVYWECFALLEEARGDLKSAVDCYERAIIRGASPEKVSDSLDQLMEKFNLLNLKPELQADGTRKTPRKQVLDARNIFKSSIIRFALQQKAVRRLSSNLGLPATSLSYVATPVRRSTRPSSSRYSVTPGVTCLKSLNELEPNLRNSVVFEPNPALG